MENVKGDSDKQEIPAVSGENAAGGDGVFGYGHVGVHGMSNSFLGVHGESQENAGVLGESERFGGVIGKGKSGAGVYGESESEAGVKGVSLFLGVHGTSRENAGVLGESERFVGVIGKGKSGAGVYGESESEAGVKGVSLSGYAGEFVGNVRITGNLLTEGDITLLNADCAEDFDIAGVENVEPGMVMVLGEEGALHQSQQAYDKRVAGVLSGAGDYKAGIVLDKQQAKGNRKPVALLGKVCCKVDASYAPIEVGDLLTTSPTSGHAMKAADPLRAFGAVIGKALRPLREGQGLIPILIALQ